MRLQSFVIGFALCAACGARTPPASETLPRLRQAITEPVLDEQQNRDNSALVQQIADAQHLDGLTRPEVEQQIGKGDRCASHPLCGEKGFEAEDWFYEIGTAGPTYVRVRPVLIVGFDRFGRVVRTYNLRPE